MITIYHTNKLSTEPRTSSIASDGGRMAAHDLFQIGGNGFGFGIGNIAEIEVHGNHSLLHIRPPPRMRFPT